MEKEKFRVKSNILCSSEDEFAAKLAKLGPDERDFAVKYRKHMQASIAPLWEEAFLSVLSGQDGNIPCPNCESPLCFSYSPGNSEVTLRCGRCGAEAPNPEKVSTAPAFAMRIVA